MNARFNGVPGVPPINAVDQSDMLAMTFSNPAFPANMINQENVLQYFCDHNNRFYERTSDNEQARMQTNLIGPNVAEFLVRLNGIQYVLHNAQPPLFVICKQRRHSPTNVSPLAYYYVLNGVVYQAPDLYTVCQSRMVAAVEPLKKALGQTLEFLRSNVTKGYYWEFKTEPAKRSGARVGDDPTTMTMAGEELQDQDGRIDEWNTRATPYQHMRTEMLLHFLREEFPDEPPSSK